MLPQPMLIQLPEQLPRSSNYSYMKCFKSIRGSRVSSQVNWTLLSWHLGLHSLDSRLSFLLLSQHPHTTCAIGISKNPWLSSIQSSLSLLPSPVGTRHKWATEYWKMVRWLKQEQSMWNRHQILKNKIRNMNIDYLLFFCSWNKILW